jgi:hypothetical protein
MCRGRKLEEEKKHDTFWKLKLLLGNDAATEVDTLFSILANLHAATENSFNMFWNAVGQIYPLGVSQAHCIPSILKNCHHFCRTSASAAATCTGHFGLG